MPVLSDADVVQLVNGPEAFTPDGEFLLGESEVKGYFVAAGFNAHGIAGAGGNGKVIAEWIVGGEPPMDLWKMDIRRFGEQYRSRSYSLPAPMRCTAYYYIVVIQQRRARPAARSRCRLRTPPPRARSLMGEKSGWERGQLVRSNADPAHELCARADGRAKTVDGNRHRTLGHP